MQYAPKPVSGYDTGSKYAQIHDSSDGLPTDDVGPVKLLLPAVYRAKLEKGVVILTKVFDRYPDIKIIGNLVTRRLNRVKMKWNNDDENLGVMFCGKAGAGKSVSAETLANKFIDEDHIPVVEVDDPLSADQLRAITDSHGIVLMYFREFDKAYAKPSYDTRIGPATLLLEYMSEKSTYRRLNIFTANEGYEIDQYIRNRPGRIQFWYTFGKISEEEKEAIFDDIDIPDSLRGVIDRLSERNALSLDEFLTSCKYFRLLLNNDESEEDILSNLMEHLQDLNIRTANIKTSVSVVIAGKTCKADFVDKGIVIETFNEKGKSEEKLELPNLTKTLYRLIALGKKNQSVFNKDIPLPKLKTLCLYIWVIIRENGDMEIRTPLLTKNLADEVETEFRKMVENNPMLLEYVPPEDPNSNGARGNWNRPGMSSF